MWRIATLLVAVSVASVQAGVNYANCRDKYGGYGVTVACDGGFVPVALCSSGRDSDCQGYYTRMRCCQETVFDEESLEETAVDVPETRACDVKYGGYGEYVQCAAGRMALQVCTSGRDADCGNRYTMVNCCDDHSQSISTSCGWLHGNYGILVECGYNMVITGVCSSGRDSDCRRSGSGAYTGILCCAV